MNIRTWLPALLALSLTAGVASAADAPKLPAAVQRTVDFNRDVRPILAHRCAECHGAEKAKGLLRLDSREAALKGGRGGPAFVVGKSADSELIRRVAGIVEAPEHVMPPKGAPLKTEEIAILRAWIDQGAKWTAAALIDRGPPPSVAPRQPVVPPGEGAPLDRILAAYFTQQGVVPPAVVSDAVFARRVYFDVVGLPPTPPELAAFLADRAADKREQLVAKLLADNRRYADHWITFWQDHLRDGKKDLGTTDVFSPITDWLEHSLVENKPFDRFVRELVDPADNAKLPPPPSERDDAPRAAPSAAKRINDAAGFIAGLQAGLEVPRGDQAWQVQAVQNLSQVFLGVQLKCATCHDSFLDRWSMAETWGMANIYADQPLEMMRCEVPTGKKPAPRFLFPDVGNVDAAAPVKERRAQLAQLMTSSKNGRFARTVVNRLWVRLLGRGLVEPLDDMSAAAWNTDLLDWLANDLVAQQYDLKKTLYRILTSRAYQLPAVEAAQDDAPYVFRGPLVRRLSAEQFVDALSALSDKPERIWRENGNRLLDVLGRPDRRTVVTHRECRPSPLQALELLNGAELHGLLSQVRGPVLQHEDNAALVRQVFQHALSREPTEKEARTCAALLGSSPTAASRSDLLWIIAMLPEFQLLR
ncbi:MAG: PSD1 domain-containing protein [Planctomycetia bacterium]|nr:PSD1 domain-containing protein [Planctomycetia bacterium]